jgi:M6 family metalloprotease-like protein
MPRTPYLLLLLGAAFPVPGVGGQDVEMLGERYGTPVPAGYERTLRADASAFHFERAWRVGSLDIVSFEGASGGPALAFGPRSEPVVGEFRIPVLLGMYSNSGATGPFPRTTIQGAYFTGGPGTITHYYREVSRDKVSLFGDVFDWVQTARPDTDYTVGESGLISGPLGGGGAGNFVYELVAWLDAQGGLNWGEYDNDGPDGIPNSGDDDGVVDVLAVVHPTWGAECGGAGSADRIWSHRWTLSSAVGRRFTTSTPRTGTSGSIRINDYIIQPSISCPGGAINEIEELNEIGVFTHELGHAFGLPDLYDTCDDGSRCPSDTARTSGAGVWDLMASGSWGCNDASPASPCHMGAWSKAMLGWVDVETLGPDFDHGTRQLPPVATSGTVYRIDANDGSGEYFLLENRQRIGYDQNLYAPGLLVWQVDPDWVSARWPSNRVNANEHQGVWLRQADGRDDLGRGVGRGDEGDPFPGSTANVAFHAASEPGAISFGGGVTGVTVVDIGPAAAQSVALRLLTRFTTITFSAEGAAGSGGLFSVNGTEVDPPATTFSSAPFVEHAIEASAGEAVGPGERRPFTGWQDDPSAPRTRTIVTPIADTGYVATYGGTQFELALTMSGGVNGVEPAAFTSLPLTEDFWFDDSTEVTLQAVPRTGFAFSEWLGALAGMDNPAQFAMSSPLSAEAAFTLVYGVASAQVEIPAATPLELQLEVENGTAPVTWRLVDGAMPIGTTLSRSGVISGASLETGRFGITVEAVDAIGLPANGAVLLDMVLPSIPLDRLTSTFLLSGPALTDHEINFLNLQGNGIAPYDIGDFRAWVLASPTLPLSADLTGAMHRRTVTLRRPEGVGPEGAWR